ncbi:hypothetical protein Ddc_12460 [Ditylenchus destructor]|nr:hypothetical protein Ddc_12460 [Ditylenchus destructor]
MNTAKIFTVPILCIFVFILVDQPEGAMAGYYINGKGGKAAAILFLKGAGYYDIYKQKKYKNRMDSFLNELHRVGTPQETLSLLCELRDEHKYYFVCSGY